MDIEFIEKWQTLIGSALGPFLAIILSVTVSVVVFFVRGKWQKNMNRKESIRKAEIAFSQTLTHINIATSQLEGFIHRATAIKNDVSSITSPSQYSVQETNFPATINIYFDEELIKMKFQSYYVHNKILITDYLVKSSNDNIQQFRYDFERLLDRNERLAVSGKMNPTQQKEAFVENLGNFIGMIEIFTDALKINYAKSIAKAKVYNLKLMKNHLHTIWKYEGKFRYFKNKKEMEKYRGSMETMGRIDSQMEEDAVDLMNEVRERESQNQR